MNYLFFGIFAFLFLKKNKIELGSEEKYKVLPEPKNEEKMIKLDEIPDKGDRWSVMRRSISELSDIKTRSVFQNLIFYINQYNNITNKNFKIFEALRPIQRQIRLIQLGNSQANPNFAPHPQGRAIDIVEYNDGIWVWNSKNLKGLNDYLSENFPQWNLLRTGRDFTNFVDWPHYEIKRDIWESWQ